MPTVTKDLGNELVQRTLQNCVSFSFLPLSLSHCFSLEFLIAFIKAASAAAEAVEEDGEDEEEEEKEEAEWEQKRSSNFWPGKIVCIASVFVARAFNFVATAAHSLPHAPCSAFPSLSLLLPYPLCLRLFFSRCC